MATDWNAWSRECTAMMTSRSRELVERRGLKDAPYTWDLDTATFTVGALQLALTVVGTVEQETFMWAWGNPAIPPVARRGIERVQAFGVANGLRLLREPCAPGGLEQGKECVAIAGRILDATSVWIDRVDEGHILFVLFEPLLAAPSA
jgi:hypothetical protein